MKILLFILINLFSLLTHAQKEDNTWILGRSQLPYRLEFNDFELSFTPELDREVQMHGTNTSLSDEDGNLMFYTNGIHIFNHLNEIVENGDSINCCDFFFESFYDFGYPSHQGAFFIKSNIQDNIYFLIHSKMIPEFGVSVGSILYSTIDVSANNGLGKVLEKNIVLFDETPLDNMHLTRHANGRDWWIVMPDKLENKFHRFLFTQDTFQGPFEQAIDDQPNNWSAGYKFFSPNGQKYAHLIERDEISILDFDRCTGEFSNEVRFRPFPLTQLPDIHLFYGVAFSPNSQFLYLQYGESSTAPPIPFTPHYGILQYDMSAANIENSKFEIIRSEIGLGTSMGNGLDGKIYFLSQYGNLGAPLYISAINQPNKKGVESDIDTLLLELPVVGISTFFPHFPNYRLGPIDGSPCDTLGIDNLPLAGFRCEPDSNNNLQIIFTDNSFYEPTEWSWSFGDGEMSADTSPVHTFAELGIYEVCLTVSNDNASDTYCKILDLQPVGIEEVVLEEGEFLVFPNPTASNLTVKIPDNYLEIPLTLTLVDVTGKISSNIKTTIGTTNVELEIAQLPNGIYFLKAYDQSEQVFSTKVVISK